MSDLLGYSTLERGRLAVYLKKGDLSSVVRQCVELYGPLLKSLEADVALFIQNDLPHVAFDADAVSHIVQNLLDNAEKYSRDAQNRTIEVSLMLRGAYIHLSVRDHGRGLHEKMEHLVKPFSRGRGDIPSGLGLGLTLIHALAKAHHGKVIGANAKDGGAIITVTFPV